MINIRLEKRSGGIWAIVVIENSAVLATRRWVYAHQAVRWCRAVMSSFRDDYSLEISDDR